MTIEFDITIDGSDTIDLNSEQIIIREYNNLVFSNFSLDNPNESILSNNDSLESKLSLSLEKMWGGEKNGE